MIQVVSGSSSGSIVSGTAWTELLGGVKAANASVPVGDPIPIDCTVRNILLEISAAPGALGSGASRRFTVCVNDVETSVIISIEEDLIFGIYTFADLNLLEGQWVTLKCESFGAAGAGFTRWGYEIETAGATQAVFFGSGGPLNSYPVRYGGVIGLTSAYERDIDGGPESCIDVVPIDGTITGYRVRPKRGLPATNPSTPCGPAAPGILEATCTIYKSTDGGVSFVAQDGTGGTVDTRLRRVCPNPLVQGQQEFCTFELPVARGDLLYRRWDVDHAGFAQWGIGWGLLFTSSEENQWPYCGQRAAIGTGAGPSYNAIFSANAFAWSGSDTGRARSYGGVTDFSLARPIFYLENAPGPGDTRAFAANKNGVDQDLIVNFAEGDHFAEDLINAVPISYLDEFGITATNSGSPGSDVSWGYVQGVEAPEEGGGGDAVLLPRGVIGPLIVHHIPYDDGAT